MPRVRFSLIAATTLLACMAAVRLYGQNNSAFDYVADPPYQFAFAAGAQPQFPTPSQCVQAFGLACYTPALIRRAYDVPSNLQGAGQSIVIVDAYGSPTLLNDLKVFDQVFGLPDPMLNIYFPGGSPAFNPLQSHGEVGWAFETSLDVEWAHAIAPQATINLVIAANNGGNVLNNAVKFAIDNQLGNVMSLSWGAPEGVIKGGGNNTQLAQAHANFIAAQQAGITVFASSGDFGATNLLSFVNALYPASDPLVTAVGGTNVFIADSGAYQGETVWNDANPSLCPFGCAFGAFGATGGAPSVIFAAPAYQQALSGNLMRTTSDVGYNASVYTGVLTFFSAVAPAGFFFTGGTSEGAPQWAGIAALANQAAGHPLGLLNPALYAIAAGPRYGTDFHDVTLGDNGFFGPGFPAQVGYDLPTGIGTPDVSKLISSLTK